ncbi:hypothetical protein L208DRAFT_1397249 [Tricholoma matsutake]|nr:hypothetical protein L208DRAFT_1397249 [Tricholoma matsutake 945]
MELNNKAWVPLPALSLEDQLSKLLVCGPVANVNSAGPNLIIIDGLPQIEAYSKDDIRKFFVKALEKIKREHLSSQGLSDWPPKSSVHKLVEKSEGLFVYAATAVQYISGEGNPKKRLADVLELHKGLDPLYTQVIGEAKKWDYCDIVMGTLMHLQYPLPIDELSMVLLTYDNSLESDGIHFALGGCHSIVIIPRDNTEINFLPAMSHGQVMVGCLGAITRSFSDGSIVPAYALISWHHHASLFLSALGANEGLGGLKDEAEELVKKIDLKWVKVWLVQALPWAGVPYLRGESTQKKLQGLAKRDGTQVLEQKLRSISGILEKVSLSYDQCLKHNC